MKNKPIQLIAFCGILLLLIILPVQASAGSAVTPTVSPNIPLNSYIYTYLAKLDGLGYLEVMPPDTKPYTRMQVAQWVKQMNEKAAILSVPDYAQAMLVRLQKEFDRELAVLATEKLTSAIYQTEATGQAAYYDGQSLMQHNTNSTYQPLNVNNNGYRLAEGLNSMLTLSLSGTVNDYFAFNITPRFSYDSTEDGELDLTSGYFQTRIGNLGIQLGKDELWWGPGEWGSLNLTNNATPQTALKLTNLEPIRPDGIFKFLKEVNGAFFYSELEKNRYVPGPSFVGFRATVTPFTNVTFGAALNSMVGGEGHQLSGADYLEFFTGKNADSNEAERWNSNAGFDFHWRIPQLKGIQIYGEYYGEDQAGKFPPLPSRNAYLFGIKLPRLSADGKWDLTLEKAFTTNWWYQHWVYKNGYTYKGDIIGDAMGYNATRYDLKLSRYLNDGSWLSLNVEQLVMDHDVLYPQQVNSIWLSYHRNLQDDLTFGATIGYADIGHFNYQAGRTSRNYLVSIDVTKKF